MIRFLDLSKSYGAPAGRRLILDRSNAVFEDGHNYAIMGPNGSGKSTVMRLISGADLPSAGQVLREENTSWPLGFHGGFNGTMTGRENVAFVARIYGQDPGPVLAAAEEFAEIGAAIHMPVSSYSTGMKQRLAFGLSLSIRFDSYLVDETISVGDARFRRKCEEALAGRMTSSRVIMISHSEKMVRKYCDRGMLLWQGSLFEYDDLDDLIRDYKKLCS